jgi:hypothetical protein
MYYKVTVRYKNKGKKAPTFEYITDAPDIESVYGMADDCGKEVLNVCEMTIPEIIEHEKRNLLQTVVRAYVFTKYRNYDVKTRMKKFNEFDWEGEEFFLALQSFNNHDASFRRLMKRKKSGEIELDEFLEIMDGIVNYIADNSLN